MTRLVTNPPESQIQADGATPGGWWHERSDGRIVCDLCPRACSLQEGDRGFCFVRENRDGQMMLTTYGRSTGFCIDPIEKKPLNHFYPGTSVLSFGTAGCNLGCKFCQNWSISKSREVRQLSRLATPATIAHAAQQLACQSVAFTYNDPVVWAEYAIDTARECRARGVKTVAVTAGYINACAREAFFEYMDAANVDLKAFTEEFYQQLTLSHIQPVLDTLRWLHEETDVWFEITNLVIPGANDETDEFRRMCDWILQNVGADVPVHFTAFHPDFRLQDRGPTPVETLLAARQIALDAGIRYAYVGNVNDERHQSTYCARCGELLIERNWYQLGRYAIRDGACQHCGFKIAGRWLDQPGDWGRKRQPVDLDRYALPLDEKRVSCPTPTESAGASFEQSQNSGPQASRPQTSGFVTTTELEATARNSSMTSSETPSDQPTVSAESVASRFPHVDRPELTAAQQRAVLRAASEMIRAAVEGTELHLSDETLAGAAGTPVLGCFVSIKRQKHLRGCCGFLGQKSALLPALHHSAVTSATGDVRMPKIVPSELPHLRLEVWLLYGQRAVEATGEGRRAAVEIGRHGLQIHRGTSRGLLLPGVATDHGYDAEAFLQQVCLKAGLPPHAWRELDTQLATFEGVVVEGTIDHSVLSTVTTTEWLYTPAQLQQLANFCAENLVALTRGAVPNYYLAGGADGNVNGVHLQVRLPRREPLSYIRLSPRTSMPLQATLFQMVELAAGQLRLENRSQLSRDQLGLDLTLFYEPAMHGSAGQPDLAGFECSRRAIVLQEQSRLACVYDPDLTSDQLLSQAAQLAQVRMPDAATITSYAAQSTSPRMVFRQVPQPQRGTVVRPPAVAGTFYPADPAKLQAMLDESLTATPVTKERWQAAMVPHAGLIYSGRIAAAVLQQIEIPDTIVILGPKHTQLGVDWAVAPHQIWEIPGAQVASDPELAAELCRNIEGLQLDAAAHQREHAIEVELPWLARLAPQSRVVGIVVGQADRETCRRFAMGLAKTFESRRESTLFLVSSDMNHYANDVETRRLDAMALEALQAMDPDRLLKTTRTNRISMCGVLPACMVLDLLQMWGANREARQVAYATSAEVSGDPARVVGYAGMLFR